MLTINDVESAIPSNLNVHVDQDLVDQLNNLSTDPMAAATIRDHFLGFSIVLREGKFKLDDYVNAVAYVSYKLMGYTNRESYQRAFPDRIQRLVAEGRNDREISAYVAGYHKNKLVQKIMERAYVPVWLVNQDAVQEAINTQREIMNDPKINARERVAAANSLLTNLKPPEKREVSLNIGLDENRGMADMKKAIRELAQHQIGAIEGGKPTKEIAHSRIIDAEVIRDDE